MSKWTMIEASAGTGKTYTLTQMVCERLAQDYVPGQILLVTFSEKAAQELRERIRRELEVQVQKGSQTWAEEALSHFSSFTISTIHGFCQSVLQNHPLESGTSFGTRVVNEGEQVQKITRQLVADHWHALGIEELQKGSGVLSAEEFLEELQESFQRGYGDRPDEVRPTPHELGQWEARWGTIQKDWQQGRYAPLFQALIPDAESRLARAFERVKDSLNVRNAKNPFLSLLECYRPEGLSEKVQVLSSKPEDLKKYLEKWISQEGLCPLQKKNTVPSAPDLKVLEDHARAALNFLEQMEGEKLLTRNFLSRWTWFKTLKKWNTKLAQSWEAQSGAETITFRDMIRRVHQKLTQKDSSLLKQLQNRFKLVLVDEFQDTDRWQWEIFEKLGEVLELVVVGDPKQSIYGFRGADLQNYLKIRNEIQSRGPGAELRRLDRNFRSSGALIEAFNTLFHPLFPEGSPLTYAPAAQGYKDAEAPQDIPSLPGLGHALEVYSLEKNPLNLTALAQRWAYQIVARIHELLTQDPPVSPSDILILTEKNRDNRKLYRLLRQKKIPCRIAGVGSLFSSVQAQEILVFLLALEKPRDPSRAGALLLSRYFGETYQSLSRTPQKVEKIQTKLLENRHRALAGNWTGAFQSVLSPVGEEDKIAKLLSQRNGERLYTDYFHILEVLEKDHRDGKFLPHLATAHLQALMKGEKEDETTLRLENEEKALRIMTIFSSKGLEAPIVFYYGGLKTSGLPRVWEPPLEYLEEGRGRVWNFVPDKKSEEKAAEFLFESQKRLFYVALTRAKNLLVLPFMPQKEDLLLSALSAFFREPLQELMARNPDLYQDKGPGHLLTYADFQRLEPLQTGRKEDNAAPDSLRLRAFPQDLNRRWERAVSFSTLIKNEISHPFREEESELFTEASESPLTQVISPETAEKDPLPAGTQFGTMVHEILEDLDFQSYKTLEQDSSLAAVIEKKGRSIFQKRWSPESTKALIQLLKATLTLPLAQVGPQFFLGQIAPQDCWREMVFHLYSPLAGLPELLPLEGYFTGVIDLIFRWENRLYILDWKTNLLRGGKTVESCVEEHQYGLQAQAYFKALQRLLNLPRAASDLNLEIGGAFYLFLRAPGGLPEVRFFPPQELGLSEPLEGKIKELGHGQ